MMMTNQTPVSVLIAGATGKMGKEFVKTCLTDNQLNLVACTSRSSAGKDIFKALSLDINNHHVPIFSGVPEAITAHGASIQVGVDLTHPSTVYGNALAMIHTGISPILGATGLSEAQLQSLDEKLKSKGLAGAYIPNFSIGAVLLMQFAAQAAKYFNHAEIIEMHHNQKADAPSGTSLHTAELMQKNLGVGTKFSPTNGVEKETHAGARGATTEGGIHIHSVRLPGLVAHQEVLFGEKGQLLTLRHDSFDRTCFMAGIALSVKQIRSMPAGLHRGLECFLDG
ncbi:MAG: 4-hydroxy-tetrahydrodipicolinate reductase [Vampirovibrio sp.]|nr:4-hydroxy-tetrahydrodipicolinate reductase [Vampirovibrio sp.]